MPSSENEAPEDTNSRPREHLSIPVSPYRIALFVAVNEYVDILQTSMTVRDALPHSGAVKILHDHAEASTQQGDGMDLEMSAAMLDDSRRDRCDEAGESKYPSVKLTATQNRAIQLALIGLLEKNYLTFPELTAKVETFNIELSDCFLDAMSEMCNGGIDGLCDYMTKNAVLKRFAATSETFYQPVIRPTSVLGHFLREVGLWYKTCSITTLFAAVDELDSYIAEKPPSLQTMRLDTKRATALVDTQIRALESGSLTSYRENLTLIQSIRSTCPQLASLHIMDALVALNLRDYPSVEKHVHEYFDCPPDSPDVSQFSVHASAVLLLARAARRFGYKDIAERCILDAVRLSHDAKLDYILQLSALEEVFLRLWGNEDNASDVRLVAQILERSIVTTQKQTNHWAMPSEMRHLTATCRCALAVLASEYGENRKFNEVVRDLHECLNEARSADDITAQRTYSTYMAALRATVTCQLAVVHQRQGHFDSAIMYARRCLSLLGSSGSAFLREQALATIGYSLAAQGKFTEALDLLDNADSPSELTATSASKTAVALISFDIALLRQRQAECERLCSVVAAHSTKDACLCRIRLCMLRGEWSKAIDTAASLAAPSDQSGVAVRLRALCLLAEAQLGASMKEHSLRTLEQAETLAERRCYGSIRNETLRLLKAKILRSLLKQNVEAGDIADEVAREAGSLVVRAEALLLSAACLADQTVQKEVSSGLGECVVRLEAALELYRSMFANSECIPRVREISYWLARFYNALEEVEKRDMAAELFLRCDNDNELNNGESCRRSDVSPSFERLLSLCIE